MSSAFFGIVAILLMAGPAIAADPFAFVEEFQPQTSGFGIAFDGTEYHLTEGSSDTWNNYDSDFNFLDTTTVVGATAMVDIDYDEASGNMFVADYPNTIHEVTLAGTIVSTFTSNVPNCNEAVVVNNNDGTLWLVGFFSDVVHVTRTGVLLGSFTTPGLNWAGADYDEFRDTLLLNNHNDAIHEYTPGGVSLGVAIPPDPVTGNGLGITYNSLTGLLHILAFSGHVAVWEREGGGLTLEIGLDIKPGSCPNPVNCNSNGVIPVALLGTEDTFDVTQVDLSSIQLSRKVPGFGFCTPNEGPPGPHSVFDDVGTPFEGDPQDPDCCHDLGGDGIQDLLMHFKTADCCDALGLNMLAPGTVFTLVLTGTLLDGTAFSAEDCMVKVPVGAARSPGPRLRHR